MGCSKTALGLPNPAVSDVVLPESLKTYTVFEAVSNLLAKGVLVRMAVILPLKSVLVSLKTGSRTLIIVSLVISPNKAFSAMFSIKATRIILGIGSMQNLKGHTFIMPLQASVRFSPVALLNGTITV